MTQTPEPAEPTTDAERRRYDDRAGRPGWPDRLLTWVGIVAGVVFIVALIFFSGFFLGRATHGPYGGRDGGCSMMDSGGRMGPGMGPGGMMGPQQMPSATTPAPHP
ncbi:hypothetical protein [Mycobacterium persicum]|uniref:Uncharacterized protein n=1 Tax=Mycobacterium persicum TaxID=1487726 RepID=A0A1X0L7D6_9MYCO|nr:hypothetical protein [Mycobacterium persicum]KZS84758.1 hypothetical protein A4G31_09535 [Mycobacterium persicum]ORB52531.1 hypothetical protein BST40_09510 [Mycobacterium persicum]ORB89426.1 hypothetical protein B1T49_09455 [Mycobacterium persicum]ORB94877.1 hypothetical protein B1T44_10540 [Mycobacterium persicum]ORC01632.1 hypothetical protein B1T48_10370 [Mycobacterium persicum]